MFEQSSPTPLRPLLHPQPTPRRALPAAGRVPKRARDRLPRCRQPGAPAAVQTEVCRHVPNPLPAGNSPAPLFAQIPRVLTAGRTFSAPDPDRWDRSGFRSDPKCPTRNGPLFSPFHNARLARAATSARCEPWRSVRFCVTVTRFDALLMPRIDGPSVSPSFFRHLAIFSNRHAVCGTTRPSTVRLRRGTA